MEVDDEAEPMNYANHDEAMDLQASDVAMILNLPIFGVGEEGGGEEEEGMPDRGTTSRTRTYSSLSNTMDASGAHSSDGATMINLPIFGVGEEGGEEEAEGVLDRGTTPPRIRTYNSLSNTMGVSGAHSIFSQYTGDGGITIPSLSNTLDTSGAHSTFSHFTGDGGTTIPLLDFSSYTDGCADSYNNIDLRTIVPNSLSSSTMPATTNMDINQALLSLATPNRPHASTPSAIAGPPISYPNVAGSYNNIDLDPREFVSSSSSLTMPATMNMDINQALLSLATPNIPLPSTASVAAVAAPISYTNFGNNIGLNPQEFVSSSSSLTMPEIIPYASTASATAAAIATPTMPAAMMNMDINQALLSLATPNIPLASTASAAAAAIATPIIDNSRALMTMEERIFESTSRTISRASVAANTTKIRPVSQKETTQQDELDTVTQQLSNLWHPRTSGWNPHTSGHSLRAAVNTSPVLSRNADAAVAASASASTAPITTQANLKLTMTMMSSINKVWANELNNLGSKEREEITNEMHGIQSDREKMMAQTESSPKMIDLTIESFRLFLEININEPLDNGDSIAPPVSKDPYRRGLHVLGSRYIISKGFLLKFLRTAHYDFTKSALRYFRYLDLLYIFFGDDGITRKLCLTDLTKHEHTYLRKGQMQLLPRRDRSGRRLYAFSGYDMPTYNIIEKYRVNIYLIDAVSDDTTTQKLGCVTINAPRIRFKVKNPFGHEGMTILTGKHDLLGCTESQFFTKMFEGCKYLSLNYIVVSLSRTLDTHYNFYCVLFVYFVRFAFWKSVRHTKFPCGLVEYIFSIHPLSSMIWSRLLSYY